MGKHSLQASIDELARTDPHVRDAIRKVDAVTAEIISNPPALRFKEWHIDQAAEEWRFSCGPAALCAILSLTPEEVRPHLVGFKGWMAPTAMYQALRSLKTEVAVTQRHGDVLGTHFPSRGIARVQWLGPWMRPEVPVPARYKHTHWVASWKSFSGDSHHIYDINNLTGWQTYFSWRTQTVPWLLEQVKRADGWCVTHSIETFGRAP